MSRITFGLIYLRFCNTAFAITIIIVRMTDIIVNIAVIKRGRLGEAVIGWLFRLRIR